MPGTRGSRPGWLALSVLIIIADQLTKLWVSTNVPYGEIMPVFGRLSITHARNTGSAFGLFVGHTILLTIIAVAGVLVILVFYRYLSRYGTPGQLGLSLVLGGAAGNLIDRIRLGYVTDFINVRLWSDVFWPAFNIADSCISIGALILIAISLRVASKGRQEAVGQSENQVH